MRMDPDPCPAPRDGALLFAYGTLRRGGSNDIAHLVPDAALVAAAGMRGRLYDLGEYPTLQDDQSAPWVAGELYRIPGDGWAILDCLEDIVTRARPGGHYFRVSRQARCGDGRVLDCQVYIPNPAVQRLEHRIECADWMAWVRQRRATP